MKFIFSQLWKPKPETKKPDESEKTPVVGIVPVSDNASPRDAEHTSSDLSLEQTPPPRGHRHNISVREILKLNSKPHEKSAEWEIPLNRLRKAYREAYPDALGLSRLCEKEKGLLKPDQLQMILESSSPDEEALTKLVGAYRRAYPTLRVAAKYCRQKNELMSPADFSHAINHTLSQPSHLADYGELSPAAANLCNSYRTSYDALQTCTNFTRLLTPDTVDRAIGQVVQAAEHLKKAPAGDRINLYKNTIAHIGHHNQIGQPLAALEENDLSPLAIVYYAMDLFGANGKLNAESGERHRWESSVGNSLATAALNMNLWMDSEIEKKESPSRNEKRYLDSNKGGVYRP